MTFVIGAYVATNVESAVAESLKLVIATISVTGVAARMFRKDVTPADLDLPSG